MGLHLPISVWFGLFVYINIFGFHIANTNVCPKFKLEHGVVGEPKLELLGVVDIINRLDKVEWVSHQNYVSGVGDA